MGEFFQHQTQPGSFFLVCPSRDYLTGFHKRKVERRKVAVAEIRKKIKDEQIRVREEVIIEVLHPQTEQSEHTWKRWSYVWFSPYRGIRST